MKKPYALTRTLWVTGARWREDQRRRGPACRRGDVGHVDEGDIMEAEEESRAEQSLEPDVPFPDG